MQSSANQADRKYNPPTLGFRVSLIRLKNPAEAGFLMSCECPLLAAVSSGCCVDGLKSQPEADLQAPKSLDRSESSAPDPKQMLPPRIA
jgi:hypothetical protein